MILQLGTCNSKEQQIVQNQISTNEPEVVARREIQVKRQKCLHCSYISCHSQKMHTAYYIVTVKHNSSTKNHKMLSCHREATRCFMSLNILLSLSRSLKVIRNNTLEYGMCKS